MSEQGGESMPIIGKGKLEKGKYWRNLREEKKKRREERARKNNIMVIRVIQRKKYPNN